MNILEIIKKTGLGIERGQALIELAVFGTIFIIFLGVLVSYGVKYNYQQNVRQKAFKMALANANDRVSSTAIIIEHNPIPDPSDAFGLGSATMVVGSASVTKNFQYIPPGDGASLPVTNMKFSGSGGNARTEPFYNAAIRTLYIGTEVPGDEYTPATITIDSDLLSKYRLVYGNAVDCSTVTDSEDSCYGLLGYVRFVDSCAGALPDYGSCKETGKLATDSAFCAEKCVEDKLITDTTKCATVCAFIITPTWYSGLDGLFGSIGTGPVETNTMGLQQDMKQVSVKGETITKSGGQTNPSGSGDVTDTIHQVVKYQTTGGGLGSMNVDTTASTSAGIPLEE